MKTIVVIGDSIAWGFPYGLKYSWVTYLQKCFHNLKFINRGACGDTFEGILARLERDVICLNPDYCIICSGINDACTDYSIDEIKKNIILIISLLKKNRILPILCIPFNINGYVNGFQKKVLRIQNLIHKIATDNHIKIFDFRFLDKGDYFDDIHPNKKGYLKLGKELKKNIDQL